MSHSETKIRVLIAQLLRALSSGMCRVKRHGFELRLIRHALLARFTLFSFLFVSFLTLTIQQPLGNGIIRQKVGYHDEKL